jgi:hypothetical protein
MCSLIAPLLQKVASPYLKSKHVLCSRIKINTVGPTIYLRSVLPIFPFHWFYSPLGPWPMNFSSMIISQTVGLLGRVISSSHRLYLNAEQHKTQNKHTYETSISCVGFEPTIPASERAKTVHALDRWTIVAGILGGCFFLFQVEKCSLQPNENKSSRTYNLLKVRAS